MSDRDTIHGLIASWTFCNEIPPVEFSTATVTTSATSAGARARSTSRNQSPRDRSMERARGIRLRLGESASLFEPFPSKPKGMWSKTYQRLRDRSERDEMVHWRQLVERHRLSGM